MTDVAAGSAPSSTLPFLKSRMRGSLSATTHQPNKRRTLRGAQSASRDQDSRLAAPQPVTSRARRPTGKAYETLILARIMTGFYTGLYGDHTYHGSEGPDR